MRSDSGAASSLAELAPHQVYLNARAAEDLAAGAGDQLYVFVRGRQQPMVVAGVVAYEGTGTDGAALLVGSARREGGRGTG